MVMVGLRRETYVQLQIVCIRMQHAAAATTHLVLPKLDWLDAVVYANCGYVLADELLFTVPEHQSSVLSPAA
jgi:hypothetical protein